MHIMVMLGFVGSVLLAWIVGYRTRSSDKTESHQLPNDYLVGLNFLLNEETDKAVDVFIKMLEVDSETVETHLAIGKLFRKRGEVDRAIKIHQNLMARPDLKESYKEYALYELGQDYLSAGMFDRAEGIFKDLAEGKTYRSAALKILIDIYQQEKNWEKAVFYAEKFQLTSKEKIRHMVAHFYCELAEKNLNNKLIATAKEEVEFAIKSDKRCVRAYLLSARIFMAEKDYQSAIKALKQIKERNSAYLSESIELLVECYENLDKRDELIHYLQKLVVDYPRVPVVLILAERIRQWKGDKVAANFVADYVRRYPSLQGLSSFIDLYIYSTEGRAKEDLTILQNLMHKLLASKPAYQCSSCGFTASILQWHCPGCRKWSTMLPVHSIEAEAV